MRGSSVVCVLRAGSMMQSVRSMSQHAVRRRARKQVSEEQIAETVAASAAKAKAMANTQLYLGTLGNVADSYCPGVSEGGLARRAKSELATRLAEGKLRKDVPHYSRSALEQEARRLYDAFQRAFAAHDVTALRELCAPHILTDVKSRLNARPTPAVSAAAVTRWEGTIDRCSLLTVRFIPLDEFALNFAQVAFRYDTTQRLCVYDEREGRPGKLVKETPWRNIEETWVLERITNKRDDRWKLCGYLPLPPGKLSLMEMQEQMQAKNKE